MPRRTLVRNLDTPRARDGETLSSSTERTSASGRRLQRPGNKQATPSPRSGGTGDRTRRHRVGLQGERLAPSGTPLLTVAERDRRRALEPSAEQSSNAKLRSRWTRRRRCTVRLTWERSANICGCRADARSAASPRVPPSLAAAHELSVSFRTVSVAGWSCLLSMRQSVAGVHSGSSASMRSSTIAPGRSCGATPIFGR